MHTYGNIRAAIHGKAELLQTLGLSRDPVETVVLNLEYDSGNDDTGELDYLEQLVRKHPELEIAVIAQFGHDTGDPSGKEWCALFSPAGEKVLWGQKHFDGALPRVNPTAMSIVDHLGQTHTFTAASFAQKLAWGPNEGRAAEYETIMKAAMQTYTELSAPEGIGLYVKRTPEGVWSVAVEPADAMEDDASEDDWEEGDEWDEFPELDWGKLLPAVSIHRQEQNRRAFFLDDEGNEYFTCLDWALHFTRSDWGFPEDADWIPFDLEIEPAEDGEWDEEGWDE